MVSCLICLCFLSTTLPILQYEKCGSSIKIKTQQPRIKIQNFEFESFDLFVSCNLYLDYDFLRYLRMATELDTTPIVIPAAS